MKQPNPKQMQAMMDMVSETLGIDTPFVIVFLKEKEHEWHLLENIGKGRSIQFLQEFLSNRSGQPDRQMTMPRGHKGSS